jgi:hypothetical protein
MTDQVETTKLQERLETMTKAEKSLLLYFETAAVDHDGKLQSERMNAEDFQIADGWVNDRFIEFGRVNFKDIRDTQFPFNHWVILSNDAWDVVQVLRKIRAERSPYGRS